MTKTLMHKAVFRKIAKTLNAGRFFLKCSTMQEHAHKIRTVCSPFVFSFKVLQAQFGVSHAVFQMLILTSGVCIAPDPDPDPDRQVSNLGSATPTEALCGPKGTELA
jgi:hypothetical protein